MQQENSQATFISSVLELAERHAELSPERIALNDKIGDSPEMRRAIAMQVSLRDKLRAKLPHWARHSVYIPHSINLEQCSSQEAAVYKQSFVRADDTLLDLTGGMGVDFWAMLSKAQRGIYVEQSTELSNATLHNLVQLIGGSKEYAVLSLDSMEHLEELIAKHRPSLIYIDPARRSKSDSQERVYAIEDCSPSIYEVLSRLRAMKHPSQPPRLLVKLSPMLDVKHCLKALPEIRRIDVVAVQGEVKELLLSLELSPKQESGIESTPLVAVDLRKSGEALRFEGSYEQEEQACPLSQEVEGYLYEPNGALLKLGLYNSLGRAFQLKKLQANTHLYTSSKLIEGFPGRSFKVEEVIPYQSKLIKEISKRYPRGAQITCRNFPLSAEQLRKKLKLKECSEATLVATTLLDGSQALIYTTKPSI